MYAYLYINPNSYKRYTMETNDRSWLHALMAHELGHVLGSGKEHIITEDECDVTPELGSTESMMYCLRGWEHRPQPFMKPWDYNNYARIYTPNEVARVGNWPSIAEDLGEGDVRFRIDASDVKVEHEIQVRRKIGLRWGPVLHTWNHDASTAPVTIPDQPVETKTYGIFRTTAANLAGQEVEAEPGVTEVTYLGFLQELTPSTMPTPPPSAPTVTIAAENMRLPEGGTARFTVTRFGGLISRPLTVYIDELRRGAYFPSGATTSDLIEIPAGSYYGEYTVDTVADGTYEANGSIRVAILTASDYITGTPGQVRVTLLDNDAPVYPEPCTTCPAGQECWRDSCVAECDDCQDRDSTGTCVFVCGGGEICIDDVCGHPCEIPGFPLCRQRSEETTRSTDANGGTDAGTSVLDGTGHLLGEAEAAVKIVVYEDFLCEHCRRFGRDILPTLQTEYIDPGTVSIEYRHLAILGTESVNAAAAAECAADQGLFRPYHDLLVGPTERTFKQHARTLQASEAGSALNLATFDTCIDARTHVAAVEAQTTALVTALTSDSVSIAVPMFMVDGEFWRMGVPTMDELRAEITRARGPK